MKKKMTAACLLALALMLLAATAFAACPTDEAHRYGPWKTKRSATCKQTGLQFKYCTKCDHWEKREIPKLPHTPDEWVITAEPTCTKKGVKEAHCTECGDLLRRYIDMLPHAYGEMTVVTQPTCTQNGKGEYVCADCGKKKNETIAKLGHDWAQTSVVKAPTCKSTGTAEETCQRCARTRKVTLDRLEHVWGEWTVTQAPDGREKGVREHVCTLCGEKKTQRFYPEGTLYEDMEACEEVIRLQEMLHDLGYYNGSIRSGQFGSLTTKAVARFQEHCGLEATGIADAATLERVAAEWEKATGKSAAQTLNPEEMENASEAQAA